MVGELAAWQHPEKPLSFARSAIAHYRRDHGAMIRIPAYAQGKISFPVCGLRSASSLAGPQDVEREALERLAFSRILRALTPKQRRAAEALGAGGTWADAMRRCGTSTNATTEYRRNMRRRLTALGYGAGGDGAT